MKSKVNSASSSPLSSCKKGQAHTTIVGAGHFLQEDKGEELAELTLDFINNNPVT
jgi:pimeloyl-ACP methyl ester carboxylesterase